MAVPTMRKLSHKIQRPTAKSPKSPTIYRPGDIENAVKLHGVAGKIYGQKEAQIENVLGTVLVQENITKR